MRYSDGCVLPVPEKNLQVYRRTSSAKLRRVGAREQAVHIGL
jgi:hypothetical protein